MATGASAFQGGCVKNLPLKAGAVGIMGGDACVALVPAVRLVWGRLRRPGA
jgi:hypothetical protein